VKKHSLVPLAVIAIGLVIGGTLVYLGVKSSVRRSAIKTWCLQAYSGDARDADSLKAAGRNAVPVLIELTQYRVPAWRKRLPARVPNLPSSVRQRMVRWLTPPSDITLREAAMRAVGIIGPEARDAVPVLIRALHDPEGDIRWEAARSLAKIGQASLPDLITVLQDETNSARGLAIYALGLVGSEAQPAIPALMPLLTHPNEQLRGSTAYTLTRLGPEAVLTLIDVAAHGSPEARVAAAKVLRQLVSSPESPLLTVRKLAANENPVTRRRAMQALGDLQPATALSVKTLMAALDDPVLEVRLAAIRALENIGAKAGMALPELNRLAGDKEELVQSAARQAIEKIEAAAVTNLK
jgi:HEAT repeat protein